MKRPMVFMLVLLLAQLGLAAGLYVGSSGPAAAQQGEKLLAFDPNQVDAVELVGSGGEHLTLKKEQDRWQLPEHFTAAADGAKVQELLTTLGGLERPWPVAKTADAGQRFQVEEQNCERKLVFKSQGKTLSTLLLGSSPGFRKVHARLAGAEEIYDIPFSTYQASLKPQDWIDQQQLALKPEAISAIELPAGRLTRQEGKLLLDPLAATEQTNDSQAQQLLHKLADLRIRDIYGKADQPLPQPVVLQITLTLKDGHTRAYGFAPGDKEGYELLQVADSPYRFKVKSGLIQELQAFDHSSLAQAKAAAPAAGAAADHPAKAT